MPVVPPAAQLGDMICLIDYKQDIHFVFVNSNVSDINIIELLCNCQKLLSLNIFLPLHNSPLVS